MPTFYFDTAVISPPSVEPEDIDLHGEDISLVGGEMTETNHGDIAVVTGLEAAKQSVIREMQANPGSFPRRPEWGAGLSGMLFKGATTSVRDRVVSRARARLHRNPRIAIVHEVSTSLETGGVKLSVRCDAVGGPIHPTTIIKPSGR